MRGGLKLIIASDPFPGHGGNPPTCGPGDPRIVASRQKLKKRFFPAKGRATIRLDEIAWGGVKVNGIASLDYPAFLAADAAACLDDDNVVFGIGLNGDARASRSSSPGHRPSAESASAKRFSPDGDAGSFVANYRFDFTNRWTRTCSTPRSSLATPAIRSAPMFSTRAQVSRPYPAIYRRHRTHSSETGPREATRSHVPRDCLPCRLSACRRRGIGQESPRRQAAPRLRIRPIRTKADHEAALARIEELWDTPPGSEDADTLEVLTVLVEAYEKERIEIPPPDPIDAILFRMEQRGMGRADLQEVLGVGRGRISEILSGKRGLSKAMIRRLVEHLDIPAETLIQSTG